MNIFKATSCQLSTETEKMDSKAWIWKKKSSEKTKVDASLTRTVEEAQTVSNEKTITILNEKLASTLLDCQAKDESLARNAKMAQEAVSAREEAEAETERLKQELDVASRQGVATNESLAKSNTELKECMQQMSSLREEKDQKMQDAEEKLREMNKRVEKLVVENTRLSQAVQVKEKLIENLHRSKTQVEAEFDALMARSDSTEKENAFLKYEFHALKKELHIRCEELEFYRRSADMSQKQNCESVKKVTKLEAECQRLRVLVHKRLPGPSAVAKLRSEVEMLRGDQGGMRKKKLNPRRDLVARDNAVERLRDVEEENKILKEMVAKMNTELNSSRIMSARTSSRSLQAELSLTSGYDVGSDDGISSSSGSWANALLSELEHFRSEKFKNPPERKAIEDSDMSLMDDFVEMEKYAIVSVDTPSESGYHSSTADKDLFPVVLDQFEIKKKIKSRDDATEKPFDWLQDVLNAMLKQNRVSNQSLNELLEDIRIALGYINHPAPDETDTKRISSRPEESRIHGYITWKSPQASPAEDSLSEAPTMDSSRKETTSRFAQSNLSNSIHKIIQLVEGFNPISSLGNKTPDTSVKPTEYFVRVFQWRNSELSSVLQRFVHACDDLLNGKGGLEKFTEELSYAMEWILNNYAAPTDASSMREKIKKHIVSSELQIQNEVAVEEKSLCLLPPDAADQCDLSEENERLKDELKNSEAAKRDMEKRLLSETDRTEALMMQLQELKSSKKSKEMIEDKDENQTLINEDLDTEAQLTVAKAKLNEVIQKVSSLEVELEDKRNCCEELEATCLELQLQLESIANKEIPDQYGSNEEEKQPQKGWEITAASIKLAECQETILNLGKQLKALASPRESAVFDRVLFSTIDAPVPASATNNKYLSKRSSLRDRMLAEDGDKSPEISISSAAHKPYLLNSVNGNALHLPNLGSRHEVSAPDVGALAIVPIKKQGGGGFLRRLLLRRKKGSSKKTFIALKR